ncbi:hypothetical protein GCM10010260_29420 [Streptomyces filipinensis]|uniref:Uncharacterized protein n=1 Tax=Streptomyces filipinensis TaxID=66887 RepID=A0A918I9W7_9ACTN|nr:hypothetical protein [Streptomyces filipinensis]GGU92789.1 hypothetical protein GCM10010260_29420 [Streptomyces filipinensis]
MRRPYGVSAAAGLPVGLGGGALLILSLRSYEAWAYPRSDSWVVYGALIGGALVGLVAWAATGTEFSGAGWVMGLAFVLHCFCGTILAEQQALHDHGREATVTLRTEHAHRDYNDIGVQTGISYTYGVAVPPGLPHRPLDTAGSRLAPGQRVLATVDLKGHADWQLGGRPNVSHFTASTVRGCELLILVAGTALGGVGGVMLREHLRSRPRSGGPDRQRTGTTTQDVTATTDGATD